MARITGWMSISLCMALPTSALAAAPTLALAAEVVSAQSAQEINRAALPFLRGAAVTEPMNIEHMAGDAVHSGPNGATDADTLHAMQPEHGAAVGEGDPEPQGDASDGMRHHHAGAVHGSNVETAPADEAVEATDGAQIPTPPTAAEAVAGQCMAPEDVAAPGAMDGAGHHRMHAGAEAMEGASGSPVAPHGDGHRASAEAGGHHMMHHGEQGEMGAEGAMMHGGAGEMGVCSEMMGGGMMSGTDEGGGAMMGGGMMNHDGDNHMGGGSGADRGGHGG